MDQLKLNITNIIAKQFIQLVKNNINDILPNVNTWKMAEFSPVILWDYKKFLIINNTI